MEENTKSLLEYRPYTMRAVGSFWWRTYFIEFEGTKIGAIENKKDAKSIVALLNGAYLMGVSAVMGMSSVYS